MPIFASYADHMRLERKVDFLIDLVRLIIGKDETMAKTLAEIEADAQATLVKVQAETNAISAISIVITDYKKQISDLTAELNTAIANQADPATLQGISDAIQQTSDALDTNAAAEAALANTTPPAGGTTTPPAPPVAGPVITSISPAVGDEAGGTSVTLTGTGYAVADSVSIGGNPATGIVVNNDTSITLVTPPGTGDVPIVVTDGAGNASAPVTFRYAAAPAAAPAA